MILEKGEIRGDSPALGDLIAQGQGNGAQAEQRGLIELKRLMVGT